MRSTPRFSPGRAAALSRCDSAEQYGEEIDRQQAQDERKEAQAQWWADFQDDED